VTPVRNVGKYERIILNFIFKKKYGCGCGYDSNSCRYDQTPKQWHCLFTTMCDSILRVPVN